MPRPRPDVVRSLISFAYPFVRANAASGVLMWHHGRCGSTVLGDMLDQHSRITWKGEAYNYYVEERVAPIPFVRDLRYHIATSRTPYLGIEIKGLPCQHPASIGMALEPLARAFAAHGFRHCVHLHRRNILRKLVSVQITAQGLRPSFHAREDEGPLRRGALTIDVDKVRIQGKTGSLGAMIDYVADETEVAYAVVSRVLPTLRLYYEDHIEADPRVAYGMACDFLGLPAEPATASLRRINDRRLRDLIANFAEVEACLASTRHAWMLAT